MTRTFFVAAKLAAAMSCFLFVATPNLVRAAEIKVLAGSALESVLTDLILKFEQSSGHKVMLDSDGAVGAMTNRIRKGEAADVAEGVGVGRRAGRPARRVGLGDDAVERTARRAERGLARNVRRAPAALDGARVGGEAADAGVPGAHEASHRVVGTRGRSGEQDEGGEEAAHGRT